MNWSSFVIGMGASLAAAVLLALLAWSKGVLTLSFREYVHYAHLIKRIRLAGITSFYASRSDYDKYRDASRMVDYLRLADHSILVAAYWMAHGTEVEGIADELAQLVKPPKRVELTIAVIDPDMPYARELATYLDMDRDELVSRIRASLAKLAEARSRLSADEQSRFSIKVYRSIPIASVIILDGETAEGRIQVEVKPYKVPRHYAFAFELRGPGMPLYDRCLAAWQRVIAEADEYTPTPAGAQQA